jgi:peptidoglycan/LPS O-acetylase OafA/YrhL
MATAGHPGGSSTGPDTGSRPGEGLIRLGAVVFGIGLVAVLVVVLPFFFGKENWPLPFNLAAGVLPPLGLALALAGLVRAGRWTARANRQR